MSYKRTAFPKTFNFFFHVNRRYPGTREGDSGKQCFRADFIDFQFKLDDEIKQLLAEFDKKLKHYFDTFCSVY